MPLFKSFFPWAAVAIVALMSGCGEDLGAQLDYGDYHFSSDGSGAVWKVSGACWPDADPIYVRLPMYSDRILAPREMTENELTAIARSIDRDRGEFADIYWIGETNYIERKDGKNKGFTFSTTGVAVARSRTGPFVTFPASKQEVFRVFGKPTRVVQHYHNVH